MKGKSEKSTENTQPEDKHVTWKPADNTFTSEWMIFSLTKDNQIKSAMVDKGTKKVSLFYQPEAKTQSKGVVIYTEQGGYGILQETVKGRLKPDDELTVKLKNELKRLKYKYILFEIPLRIILLPCEGNPVLNQDQVMVPANASTKKISERIEETLGEVASLAQKIYFQGKELIPNDNDTLEKLELRPNSKLLVLTSRIQKFKMINRFKEMLQNWNFNNLHEGIQFTCLNRDIILVGVGIYKACKEPSISYTVKVYDAEPVNGGKLLVETNPTMIEFDTENYVKYEHKIENVFFQKNTRIKQGQMFTIVLEADKGWTYYGNSGQENVTGEDGAEFKFVNYPKANSSYGTGITCGNVPVILYK